MTTHIKISNLTETDDAYSNDFSSTKLSKNAIRVDRQNHISILATEPPQIYVFMDLYRPLC